MHCTLFATRSCPTRRGGDLILGCAGLDIESHEIATVKDAASSWPTTNYGSDFSVCFCIVCVWVSSLDAGTGSTLARPKL